MIRLSLSLEPQNGNRDPEEARNSKLRRSELKLPKFNGVLKEVVLPHSGTRAKDRTDAEDWTTAETAPFCSPFSYQHFDGEK